MVNLNHCFFQPDEMVFKGKTACCSFLRKRAQFSRKNVPFAIGKNKFVEDSYREKLGLEEFPLNPTISWTTAQI